MDRADTSFKESVCAMVARIPSGRVMTYGQIAALCGSPRAARIVGGVAHYGDTTLPWHRVVNKRGGLASGYPGGKQAHARHLGAEGVAVSIDYSVAIDRIIWQPDNIGLLSQSTDTYDT